MNRWRSFGVYVGLTVDEKIDPIKIAADMKGGPYNAASLHLISPWNATGKCYPWPLDPVTHKFDLTKRNPIYFDHFKALITELFKAGINVEICFFDIYQDPQWDSGTNRHCRYKPFRHNTFNKVLLSDDLYQSWYPLPQGKVGFAWIKWTGKEPNFTYALVPPFGPAIVNNYIKPVMKICADALKAYPQRTLMYKYANECWSESDGNGNWAGDGRLGDGPEVQLYFKYLWKQFGLVSLPNPIGADGKLHNFIEAFDWLARSGLKYDPLACKRGMDSNRKQLHTTLHEFHGCDDPPVHDYNIAPSKLVAAGINPKLAMFSRDGTAEDLPQAAANAKKMYKMPYPFIDIKPLGDPKMAWDNKDFRKCWDAIWTYSKNIVI